MARNNSDEAAALGPGKRGYGSTDNDTSGSGSGSGRSSRRASSSVPPHVREHGLVPHSPLHSAYSLVLRHRESSGESLSPSHRDEADESGLRKTFYVLVKMCMGTGTLALPYAFVSGGMAWSAVGIVLMAYWNYDAVRKLLACKELLDSVAVGAEDVNPNDVYAFIATKAMGRAGKVLVHGTTGITLVGVGVAYLIAASDLMQATPLSLVFVGAPILTRFANTLLCLVVVLPLSCAKSLSFLSYSSLVGLFALFFSFATILALGYHNGVIDAGAPSVWRRAFATDAQGLSRFFGVTAFSFGIPPLLFPVQGSMRKPEYFRSAVRLALTTVAGAYILVAEAVVILYDFQIPPNILSVLPPSHLATGVRLLVALVCLVTYPLAIVPLCESVEKALDGPHASSRMYRWDSLQRSSSQYQERDAPSLIHAGGIDDLYAQEAGGEGGGSVEAYMPRFQQRSSDAWSWRRFGVRSSIVLSTAILSTVVPCFGVVVSFMGAFSVAILSFVLPPLFHLLLFNARLLRRQILWDVFMFALGLVACVVATSLTAKSSLGPILRTHQCPGQ